MNSGVAWTLVFHIVGFVLWILIALDLIAYVRARASEAGRIVLQRRECMALHSGIALVFIGIVILVMVKPF